LSGRAAVDAQTISHIFYELKSTAPKLGELAKYLNGVIMQTDQLDHALLFCSGLAALQLDSMITQVDITLLQPPLLSPKWTFSPQVLAAHMQLLPPSPEKTQKQHQSYSIYFSKLLLIIFDDKIISWISAL